MERHAINVALLQLHDGTALEIEAQVRLAFATLFDADHPALEAYERRLSGATRHFDTQVTGNPAKDSSLSARFSYLRDEALRFDADRDVFVDYYFTGF